MHIKSGQCRQPSMACCIVLSYEVQISSLPRRDVPMLPFLSELPVVSRDELPFSSLLSFFFFFSAALNSEIHWADVIHCAEPRKRLTCTLFLNRAACSILYPPPPWRWIHLYSNLPGFTGEEVLATSWSSLEQHIHVGP